MNCVHVLTVYFAYLHQFSEYATSVTVKNIRLELRYCPSPHIFQYLCPQGHNQ